MQTSQEEKRETNNMRLFLVVLTAVLLGALLGAATAEAQYNPSDPYHYRENYERWEQQQQEMFRQQQQFEQQWHDRQAEQRHWEQMRALRQQQMMEE
jgi:hypothetical protein